jgi:hypothetical protein
MHACNHAYAVTLSRLLCFLATCVSHKSVACSKFTALKCNFTLPVSLNFILSISGPRILKYLNSLGKGVFLYYVAAAGTKRQWGRDSRYQKLYIQGSRDRGLVTNLGA